MNPAQSVPELIELNIERLPALLPCVTLYNQYSRGKVSRVVVVDVG